jgi:LuxR family maltose regulon positive regulatory protein
MSVTVTRTKFLVPKRRSDLLSRSRLISVFDDVLDYPYTLISAPAGYGKTSLMIDLAHQASYPFCWYSIDPLDLDPNRFLTHFIHAIQIQFPNFGGETLSLLDNHTNLLQNPVQVVSILVNEIYHKISEHFVIFLDDFHHLNSDQGICSFISRFGQEMDDNTHLVMASRTLFDFPDLPLLIGRRMVKGIGFDELAFQNLEIKSYYREILQRDITHEETETLLDRTEGWITGLVFSVDTDLARLPGSGKKGRITGADLFQYLAEQVLEKQPLPIQDFLMRSSLFDEFNAGFCELVLGQSNSESWTDTISALHQRNLFVQQVEDENSWIRYHSLFRDFLQARFHDRFPNDENKIYSRLLAIYQESESWEKAFAIARQIGNPEIMAEVIDQAYSTLIHQGRMKLLYSWLELLPEEGFKSLPKLFILRGISFTSLGNPKKGLSYINKIIKKSAIANDPQLFTRALLCRITTFRMLGHYTEALSDIDYIFEKLLSKHNNETLLAETYREAALAYLNIGNYSKSKKIFHPIN